MGLSPVGLAAQTSPSADFQRSCSGCHGADGRGDGAMAGIAMTPVPDLTRLRRDNGGFFPRERVIETIRVGDGVPAHSMGGMPGWIGTFRDDGLSLQSPHPLEIAVGKRIEALADYIGAMQRP